MTLEAFIGEIPRDTCRKAAVVNHDCGVYISYREDLSLCDVLPSTVFRTIVLKTRTVLVSLSFPKSFLNMIHGVLMMRAVINTRIITLTINYHGAWLCVTLGMPQLCSATLCPLVLKMKGEKIQLGRHSLRLPLGIYFREVPC